MVALLHRCGGHTQAGVSRAPVRARTTTSATANRGTSASCSGRLGTSASCSGRLGTHVAPSPRLNHITLRPRQRRQRCEASATSNESIPTEPTPHSLWHETLLPAVSYLTSKGERERVRDALAVAFHAHDGQRRKSGEPFIIHPVEVCVILAQLRADTDTLCAALLHDTVEDTEMVTFESIERQFGPVVASIVEGETKLSKRTGDDVATTATSEAEASAADDDASSSSSSTSTATATATATPPAQESEPPKDPKMNGTKKNGSERPPSSTGMADDVAAQDLREMFSAMTGEVRVILVKLADRLHNMRTLEHMKPEKQLKIARETLDVYAPLARMLGLHCVKAELEDLAFRYAMPEQFRMVSERLEQLQSEQSGPASESMMRLAGMLRSDEYMKAFREFAIDLHLIARTPYTVYQALVEARAKAKSGEIIFPSSMSEDTMGAGGAPPPSISTMASELRSRNAGSTGTGNNGGIKGNIAARLAESTTNLRTGSYDPIVPPQYLAPSLRTLSDEELAAALENEIATLKIRIVLGSRDPLALALSDFAAAEGNNGEKRDDVYEDDDAADDGDGTTKAKQDDMERRTRIDTTLRDTYLDTLAREYDRSSWEDMWSSSGKKWMGNELMRPDVIHPLCYHILYVTHSVYAPLPGRLKDFIATPRSNGYQALHTTVLPIGSSALFPLEIQICSEEMDMFAQLGIMRFNNYYNKPKVGAEYLAALAEGGSASEPQSRWLANLYRLFQRCQREIDTSPTAREFVDTLTTDLLARSVFVYDARDGSLVHLPRGATCADFAYSVDSHALGDWMVGCKVNGVTVEGTAQLENGDMIQVVTYRPRTTNEQTAELPPVSPRLLEQRRLWLAGCQTQSARTGLLAFFERHGGLPKEDGENAAAVEQPAGPSQFVPSAESLELVIRSSLVANPENPTCRLVVRCIDKDGLLADVARVIAERSFSVVKYSGGPLAVPSGESAPPLDAPRWFEMSYDIALPRCNPTDAAGVRDAVERVSNLAEALDAYEFVAWFSFQ